MSKSVVSLALSVLFFHFCCAQKLNVLYYGVSSDSVFSAHQLQFWKDQTVEISTMPRHMSRGFSVTLPFQLRGKDITIFPKSLSGTDSSSLIEFGLSQYLNVLTLKVTNRAIIDTGSSMAFVRSRYFRKRSATLYVIDGKKYRSGYSLTDGYGIIRRSRGPGRRLKRKFEMIGKKSDQYTFHIYKGLDAYKKFGRKGVFGVVEIKKK